MNRHLDRALCGAILYIGSCIAGIAMGGPHCSWWVQTIGISASILGILMFFSGVERYRK